MFLNSCHSYELGKELSNAGIPHVLCIKDRVRDDIASIFTRAFYLALSTGRCIKDSFIIGRQAVRADPGVPKMEEMKFILFSKDHTEVLWNFSAFARSTDSNTILPEQLSYHGEHEKYMGKLNLLPLLTKHFIGRRVEIFNTILNLRRRKIVVISASKRFHKKRHRGVGKTQLAIAVAHRVFSRSITKDGVIFVGVDGVRNFIDFEKLLHKQLRDHGINAVPGLTQALRNLNILLVIDGVDCVSMENPRKFKEFIECIINETQDVHVLMTRHTPFDNDFSNSNEIVHQHIGGLKSDHDAARLFINRSSSLSISEITRVMHSPLFETLDNHPRKIEMAASQIQSPLNPHDLH